MKIKWKYKIIKGGFKAAYGAYQRFVQQNQPEPILPRMNYTANQLFWISAAHASCGIRTPKYDELIYKLDAHPSFYHRIFGGFSSLTPFSNDFNCPPNSPMNPDEKCEVWWLVMKYRLNETLL